MDGCSRGEDGLILCRKPPASAPHGYIDMGEAHGDPQYRQYRAADDPVLRRLVAGLSAERHVVRRACFVALSERGAEAGPALKAAQNRTTSALLRRQIEQLSDLPTARRLPNERRLDRADWVLERLPPELGLAAD